MPVLVRYLVGVACAVVLTGCGEGIDLSALAQSRATGQFERTLSVAGLVDLDIRTGSGDVRVRVGPDDRVVILGLITAQERFVGESAVERVGRVEKAPPIRQAGNMIRIGDTDDDPRYDNISITYELIVPANTQIASHTGSGDQVIGNVKGAVSARAGSGDIEIEGAGGGLDAEAGSGDIRASAVGGAVKVRVGSGSIDVAQTVSGEVDVRAGSGDVSVALPRDAAVTLSLQTGSGSIDSALPVQFDEPRHRNRIEGVVRGGGTRVDIRTGSGSIHIQ
jgi:hypothetical protein